MKKLILSIFRNLGYNLTRISAPPSNVITYSEENTMLGSLKRCKAIGIDPGTIIDGGAAQGTWTEKCHPIWPRSKYVLLEPINERAPDLEKLKVKNGNTDVFIAAIGQEDASLVLSIYDDLDGSGIGIAESEHVIEKRTVPVRSIDSLVTEFGYKAPFLIKLDTHGFELPIFEGARETLKKTELVVVEVYGFKISTDALLFCDICRYMDGKGFRRYDRVDLLRREADAAFWQCDMCFIKKDNKVFQSNRYN